MGVFIVRNYEIIDRVITAPRYICIEGYTAFVRDALLSLYITANPHGSYTA